MPQFPVTPSKQTELEAKMRELGIRERDLQEQFVRSQGAGGQNVNKVATCVVLKHIPTGIEVRCQQERSQGLNRFIARRKLLRRIEAQLLKKKSEEAQRVAKIRRQKRKRSKRAKEKLVELKRKRSRKLQLRKPPNLKEIE